MRKLSILIIVFFLAAANCLAQDSIQARIIMVGDAGKLTDGHQPVISAIQKHVPFDKKTTVIYLGDNLYKTGLPDNTLPTYDIAKAPLDSQIHIAGKSDVKVYFVPGNHDWANGTATGHESILRVQSYIDVLGNNNVKMLPRDGCPGPEEVKITDDVTMIMMDSQWWLHEEEKPGIESDCPFKTVPEVLTELEEILAKNSKKLVLFAFHHPLRSYGPHGGYFTLKQHIFPLTDLRPNLLIPLPIVGSAYPLTRAIFGTAQDLKHPLYQKMIHDVEEVTKGHPNLIYMSGHEHTLQLIKDSGYYYVVSGSGSKTNRVSKAKNSLFASEQTGFAVLNISKNKNVDIKFYGVKGVGAPAEELYASHLLDFSKLPEEKKDTLRQVEYVFKDSVGISATDQFKNWTGFKKKVLGDNYRSLWNTPVAFKIFNLKKEKGGFTIESMGGGKQTKSLKLKDRRDKEWALRSMDKDAEKAVPANLRNTIAQQIVQDMISASHPYAPLVVPTLSKAVGVPAAQPDYYFVPNDPALGVYRPIFANKVAMLEYRDPTPDETDTKSTSKVINKMLEDNDHHIDQKSVLRARLLDIIIADWDRHADQWKWGTTDTGKGKLYYPVPRDRDQAFFKSDGLLIKFISRQPKMRFLKGFTEKIKDIKGFNYVARDFDRFFMNSLDRETWKAVTDSFIKELDDQVIVQAVDQLPQETKAIDSARVVNTLKARRDGLMEESLKYHAFISKTVTVLGSNEKESFYLEDEKGNLKLSVYKKDEKTDSASLMYRRVFDDKETREIRLFGFNDDDKFIIDPAVNSRIKLRIIGGKGLDTFNLKGKVRSFVYDLKQENNQYQRLRRTNIEKSTDVAVLDYNYNDFQYNEFKFPTIALGFNAEDYLLVGLGLESTTHGFRREPYATHQKVSAMVAPSFKSYQVKYNGIFNQVISKNDLLVNARGVWPTLDNFFGYGNSTEFDKELGRRFYRVRHSFFTADVLVRKRMGDLLSFSIGPSMYYYNNKFDRNEGKILENPSLIGLDSASIYRKRNYLGGKARLELEYINNPTIPTRGVTWYNELQVYEGMGNDNNDLVKWSSDFTVYAKVSDESPFSAIFRAGGGKIFTDNYQYFQGFTLGANNFLRGFNKNRFTGRSSLYSGLELRYRLFNSKSYLLPGDVGMMGFYELGRVWHPGEYSKKWHDSYGGGLYFLPYNKLMLSAVIGFSPETKLFNFSLGSKFNIVF